MKYIEILCNIKKELVRNNDNNTCKNVADDIKKHLKRVVRIISITVLRKELKIWLMQEK